MDEIIPEYMISTNPSIESSIHPVTTKDDFSFHKKGTGIYRSLCSKNHLSIMTLEVETADTAELGNEDMPTLNASEDSSDDESYDENDNMDSSDNDDERCRECQRCQHETIW